MEKKVEHVNLDANYRLTMITTELLPSVKMIHCVEENDITLSINDQDVNAVYSEELANIIANLNSYTAEQLLEALASQ